MEDTFNNVRLTNEDLVYLYQKNNDPDAMSEVILRNQGAIYQCIKEAGSKGMYSVGFDAEDAYQTACLAMMTSAKKYKPGINVKYITYSWGYIYRYIMNESAEAKFSIRIPRNIYNEMRKYARIKNEAATDDEVVNAFIGITEKRMKEYDEYASYENIASLNVRFGDNEDTEGIDYIPDTHYEALAEQRMNRLILDEAADRCLTAREKDILYMRNGINCPPAILEVIGKKYGLTRQRVNVIEKNARKKLLAELVREGISKEDIMS